MQFLIDSNEEGFRRKGGFGGGGGLELYRVVAIQKRFPRFSFTIIIEDGGKKI